MIDSLHTRSSSSPAKVDSIVDAYDGKGAIIEPPPFLDDHMSLERQLGALRSTIEGKRSRMETLKARLGANRGDLEDLEWWRSMLHRHHHHHASALYSGAEDYKEAEWRDYQRLLAHPPAAAEPQEKRYAALLRDESQQKRELKQWRAVLQAAETDALDTAAALHAAFDRARMGVAECEAAERSAWAAEEAAGWSLLQRSFAHCQQAQMRREQQLLHETQRRHETLAAALTAAEVQCNSAWERLRLLQEQDTALAQEQEHTMEAWKEAQQRYERSLTQLAQKALLPWGSRGVNDDIPDTVVAHQRYQKCLLAALDVQGLDPQRATRVDGAGAPDVGLNAVTINDLDVDFLKECEVMLEALGPLLKTQSAITTRHVARLDAVVASERDGVARSRAALDALRQEKAELSQVLL